MCLSRILWILSKGLVHYNQLKMDVHKFVSFRTESKLLRRDRETSLEVPTGVKTTNDYSMNLNNWLESLLADTIQKFQ